MALKREEILSKLKVEFKDQDEKLLKEVSYNLALANIDWGSLTLRAQQALDKLKGSKSSPLSALEKEAYKTYSKVLSSCPICKQDMRLVKLMEERPAFYCPDHRVCQPLPAEHPDPFGLRQDD